MLIEHVFVTARDAEDGLASAAQWLTASGFRAESCADPHRQQFIRGTTKASKAKTIGELPQRLWIENDRQRITLAASIEVHRKPEPLHRDLLYSLVTSLQHIMQSDADTGDSQNHWQQTESRVGERARSDRRKRIVLLCVLVGIICFFLAMGIIGALS